MVVYNRLIIPRGKSSITISNRQYDDWILFPITFNSSPVVFVTNIAHKQLDNDNWVTSAIKATQPNRFNYMSAQNGVVAINWIAVGI